MLLHTLGVHLLLDHNNQGVKGARYSNHATSAHRIPTLQVWFLNPKLHVRLVLKSGHNRALPEIFSLINFMVL